MWGQDYTHLFPPWKHDKEHSNNKEEAGEGDEEEEEE